MQQWSLAESLPGGEEVEVFSPELLHYVCLCREFGSKDFQVQFSFQLQVECLVCPFSDTTQQLWPYLIGSFEKKSLDKEVGFACALFKMRPTA